MGQLRYWICLWAFFFLAAARFLGSFLFGSSMCMFASSHGQGLFFAEQHPTGGIKPPYSISGAVACWPVPALVLTYFSLL